MIHRNAEVMKTKEPEWENKNSISSQELLAQVALAMGGKNEKVWDFGGKKTDDQVIDWKLDGWDWHHIFDTDWMSARF